MFYSWILGPRYWVQLEIWIFFRGRSFVKQTQNLIRINLPCMCILYMYICIFCNCISSHLIIFTAKILHCRRSWLSSKSNKDIAKARLINVVYTIPYIPKMRHNWISSVVNLMVVFFVEYLERKFSCNTSWVISMSNFLKISLFSHSWKWRY